MDTHALPAVARLTPGEQMRELARFHGFKVDPLPPVHAKAAPHTFTNLKAWVRRVAEIADTAPRVQPRASRTAARPRQHRRTRSIGTRAGPDDSDPPRRFGRVSDEEKRETLERPTWASRSAR